MNHLVVDRSLIAVGSGIQSLVFAILIHSIMSNTLPVGLGYWLGLGTGVASLLSVLTCTVCSAFGASEKVVVACKVLMLLPLIIFAGLFLVGGAYPPPQ